MKSLLLSLIFCATVLAAEEKSMTFGLIGEVSIDEATSFIDGGSVSVRLRDSRGEILRVHYRNSSMSSFPEYGGHFSLQFPNIEGRYVIRLRSAEERSLLDLLRRACTKTFGTSDSEQLQQRFKTERDWKAEALGSIFRQADRRPMGDGHHRTEDKN